jgi:hypothetical protein
MQLRGSSLRLQRDLEDSAFIDSMAFDNVLGPSVDSFLLVFDAIVPCLRSIHSLTHNTKTSDRRSTSSRRNSHLATATPLDELGAYKKTWELALEAIQALSSSNVVTHIRGLCYAISPGLRHRFDELFLPGCLQLEMALLDDAVGLSSKPLDEQEPDVPDPTYPIRLAELTLNSDLDVLEWDADIHYHPGAFNIGGIVSPLHHGGVLVSNIPKELASKVNLNSIFDYIFLFQKFSLSLPHISEKMKKDIGEDA